MRLSRLDLTHYGIFTNRSIDFGQTEAGRPDLHIIYGPNESGKSTTFAAFLDLLFGIEMQSRYGFRHPYATMEIGGALELDGVVRELVRRKRRQNSLLDSAGQPVAEATMLGELGRIDRESYRAMFSLDDDTLEAGGNDILASRGDLGQLLFSASTGLADLSQSLVKLQDEATEFFKLHARGSELQALKAKLAALKDEKDKIDVIASAHFQLVEARDRATSLYEEAVKARTTTTIRLHGIERQLRALPKLVRLRLLRGEQAQVAELPAPPATWLQDMPNLQRQDTEFATRRDGIITRTARLVGEIDAITIDAAALLVVDRLDQLKLARGRYETAEKDIPARSQELQQIDIEIAGILRQLEREPDTDPHTLLLGTSIIGELRDLIERRSGVEAALTGARHELTQAEQQLADAEAEFASEAGEGGNLDVPVGTSGLVEALAVQQQDDHAARRRTAERSCSKHRETLADRLRPLAPWQGDAEQLAGLMVPNSAEVVIWKQTEADVQKQIERHDEEIARYNGEILRLNAEKQAIGASTGIVDDQHAANIRATREEAWTFHKTNLDHASADAFETALRRDDITTNAQLLHAQDLAKLNQATQALAIAEANLSHATERRQDSIARRAGVYDLLAAAVTSFLPPDTSPARLETWLGARERALETRAELRQAERDLREAQSDAQAARIRILDALVAAGVAHDSDAGLDALRAVAQAAIKRAADRTTLQNRVKEVAKLVERRRREWEQAAAGDQAWRIDWTRVCGACWLGAAGVTPPIGTVREILPQIAKLTPALEKRTALANRIRDMEDDKVKFAAEIAVIAAGLGMDGGAGSVADIVTAIDARAAKLRSDQSVRSAKIEMLEDTEREGRDLAEQIVLHEKHAAEMTIFFGVASLADVAQRLQEFEKQTSLQKQMAEIERDICEELVCADVADAEAMLDQADRLALEGEQADLKGRLVDQDHLVQELFATQRRSAERLEAVGGDGAVARIDGERRTILLDIEDKAMRYLRLRLGIAAAERALRLYRERHRSSMMLHASEAFKTISRGAYTRLSTQPDKDSEILIGIDADGGSKIASDMSKGTRFQLYLALRVAGYHEFAQTRRPVPFIADDIMETFDDFRAEEAFRLFTDMAQTGQVIYLTHHRHLCDIAKRICPEVRVHEL